MTDKHPYMMLRIHILLICLTAAVGCALSCTQMPAKECSVPFLGEDSLSYVFSLDSSFLIDGHIPACRLKLHHWVGGSDGAGGEFFPSFRYYGIVYRIGTKMYSIPESQTEAFVFFDYGMKVGDQQEIRFLNTHRYPEQTVYTLKLEGICVEEGTQDSIFIFRFDGLGVTQIDYSNGLGTDDYVFYTSATRGILGVNSGDTYDYYMDDIHYAGEDIYSCRGKTDY